MPPKCSYLIFLLVQQHYLARNGKSSTHQCSPINAQSKEPILIIFSHTFCFKEYPVEPEIPLLVSMKVYKTNVVVSRYSSLLYFCKPMIQSYLLMKPTHTQPNSPVISIINRSISALIRSRTWASQASTNSISCCATDLISNSNRRPTNWTNLNDAEEEPRGLRAVGVEN